MFVEQMLPRARERLATLSGAAPVTEAADIMSRPHTDLVVVCGADGRMVGVLTKTNIVSHIRHWTAEGGGGQVDTIMIRDVASCQSGDRLQDVWAVMKARGLQRIPVLDCDGRPVGIVYARDALQALLGEAESDEALLRDYVMGVGYQ